MKLQSGYHLFDTAFWCVTTVRKHYCQLKDRPLQGFKKPSSGDKLGEGQDFFWHFLSICDLKCTFNKKVFVLDLKKDIF